MKTYKYNRRLALAVFLGLASISLLSAKESYLSEEDFYNEAIDDSETVFDPLQRVNRYTFLFNDFVYLNLLQPVADVYTTITPDPIEQGASNFFSNLRYPILLTGNLLQARWSGAWHETKRFAINSTVGLAGILAPADEMEGLAPIPAEGVGQAFGAWGLDAGPYLVLPLLGPSNLRDFFGLVGDAAVNPTSEPFSLIDDWNWEWRTALNGTEFIVAAPKLLHRYKQMKGSAIDPYSSLKNAYTQYRRSAIAE